MGSFSPWLVLRAAVNGGFLLGVPASGDEKTEEVGKLVAGEKSVDNKPETSPKTGLTLEGFGDSIIEILRSRRKAVSNGGRIA